MKNSRFTPYVIFIFIFLFFNCSSNNKKNIVITEIHNKNVVKKFYVREFFNGIEIEYSNYKLKELLMQISNNKFPTDSLKINPILDVKYTGKNISINDSNKLILDSLLKFYSLK